MVTGVGFGCSVLTTLTTLTILWRIGVEDCREGGSCVGWGVGSGGGWGVGSGVGCGVGSTGSGVGDGIGVGAAGGSFACAIDSDLFLLLIANIKKRKLKTTITASIAVRYFPKTDGRDGCGAADGGAFRFDVEWLSTEISSGLIPRPSLSRASILLTEAFPPPTGMMMTAPLRAEAV